MTRKKIDLIGGGQIGGNLALLIRSVHVRPLCRNLVRGGWERSD